MTIEWGRITWYSQLIAIVVALVIFGLGFYFGERIEAERVLRAGAAPTQMGTPITATADFTCDGGHTVRAIFKQYEVQLLLSDGRNLLVPQAISADGGRYTNDDESFVFWTKGNGAFITEGSTTTYANCAVVSAPELR